MTVPFKIGTRKSPLARAQAELVASALRRHHPALGGDGAIEIVSISTSGDKMLESALSEAGGKGLFTKEIEEALLRGDIDCAVHSMKDVPTILPEGLVISAMLPREDPRDAFFSRHPGGFEELPFGATVGTASLRRQAILRYHRPDLKTVVFRGNVGTRLKKLEDGIVDATVLAVSGLRRLQQEGIIKTILSTDIMLPAVGQGAVGIETRENDAKTRALLEPFHCKLTELSVTAERAFLRVMDGSCRTPIAALMTPSDPHGRARFDVLVAKPDGSDLKKSTYIAEIKFLHEAEELGRQAGHDMKARLATTSDMRETGS